MNYSFNGFSNTSNYPSNAPLYDLVGSGTLSQVGSSWTNIGDTYVYQPDVLSTNQTFSNNSSVPMPICGATAFSDDGSIIVTAVKRMNSSANTIISFGLMTTVDSGTTWKYLDLSGGNAYSSAPSSSPNGQQRVRSAVGSNAGDVFYIWTLAGNNPYSGENGYYMYIRRWTSGDMSVLSNWKIINVDSTFIPTIMTSDFASYAASYGCISTSGDGNYLYCMHDLSGSTAIYYNTNAKNGTDLSNSSYVYAPGIATTKHSFFCKVSGDGKVLYYMPETRVLWGTVLSNGVPNNTGYSIIPYGPADTVAWTNRDLQFAISYDGTVVIAQGGGNSIYYAKVTINSTTLTSTITYLGSALTAIRWKSSPYYKTIYQISCMSISQNPSKPFFAMGTYAPDNANINNKQYFIGKGYADVSYNGTDISFNNTLRLVTSATPSYLGACRVSSSGRAIYFLTIESPCLAGAASGPGGTNNDGGRLYKYS